MNDVILLENQKKRTNQPIWMLICFAMFCFWQMGFIYFMGPSLAVDGRTPLPIFMERVTGIIAAGYVLSILWMIFLPRIIIWTERICILLSLASISALFFPMSPEGLAAMIYIHVFCCCFMIGFETFVIVNYFTEQSAIAHLTVAYGIALFLIAIVQNDFVPITFPLFRVITIAALLLQLLFFMKMPASRKACPRYVKKEDKVAAPVKVLPGILVILFAGALMAVSGPSISQEVEHGIFIAYLTDGAACLSLYGLYKKAGIHPLRMLSVCISFGCIGFLLMYAAAFVPELSYGACALIGVGMVPCQMLPLYSNILMKVYPSRFFAPVTISLALVAVLVQSAMVEAFRQSPAMLYLSYAVIMVVLVFLFLHAAPYLQGTMARNFLDQGSGGEGGKGDSLFASPRFEALTNREKEVAECITYGYSNADIGKMLCISEHTVKDHTKNIYRKMGIHSRFELAALVNRVHENRDV